ncbi:MAG TPA: hypothetical protein VFO25_04725 [Candidatus Eremiobacteraceae bacterium]|nr:hypothetical protein [Candidatus Eremiobacteraceae bacterium]
MLSYTIDGKILRLIVSGDVTLAERRSVYDAVRADPEVPDHFVLVVDARDSSVTFRDATIDVRVRALVEGLGDKFGGTCAFIEPAGDPLYGKAFQRAGGRYGVRIGLFDDEESALRWLGAYMEDGIE